MIVIDSHCRLCSVCMMNLGSLGMCIGHVVANQVSFPRRLSYVHRYD